MSRSSFPLLATMLALSGCGPLSGRVVSKSPDEVARIGEGVFFRHGELEHKAHCNNGWVIFDDFVLVVDANFPDGAEACLADIRATTLKPVRFVFDTHHHGDHAYGNPVWSARGAVPLAHENVVREMNRYEPERWRQAARDRADVAKLDRESPMPPTLTYEKRLVLDDGTRRVELLFFGTAHTAGDGFAYLPEQKILFTGDSVVNGPHNYMGDGHTGSWLGVLDKLLALDVEIVAPGHGPCGDRGLIQLQRDYIAHLRQEVAAGIAVGRSVESLKQTVSVPERLRRYVGEFFADQIAKIHAEMTGKKQGGPSR